METRRLRPFSDDERAVSPVIAVILMVAITVVLAASVFVLTSRLAEHQQQPEAPRLMLFGQTSPSSWVVAVSVSSGDHRPLEDYRFAIRSASGGTVTVVISGTDFASTGVDTYYALVPTGGSGVQATDSPPVPPAPHFRIAFYDVSDDDRFNTLDQVRISHDGDGDGSYDDPFERGTWSFTAIYARGDAIAGQLETEMHY